MPEFVFTGPNAGQYPDERDLAGQPIGVVEPGDTRDLAAPLDGWWTEATDEVKAALADRLAVEAALDDEGEPAEAGSGEPATGGAEHPADGTLSPPVANPASWPVTAPPAVVPAATPAGVTSQEG